MQNHKTQNNGEYRNVSIAILEESPSNPRKRFKEESLKELAESFKSQGILQPLVVRETTGDENKYEVVAGARRLRAAQLAELKTVPVRIVQLSDAAAIEAQVVENLQREDTIRHRILAAVLKAFAPPFKKADVLLVVRFIVSRLQFAQVLQIAKRHRIAVDANTGAPERDLLKHVSRFEEAELCRFLLELSLLDSAYRLPVKDAEDVLLGTAKRHRIDIEKIEKEVAQKFSATRKKSGNKPSAKKTVA
jgi:ParB/RepB/Spo0J family partition protein